jgi:hypothetical protein
MVGLGINDVSLWRRGEVPFPVRLAAYQTLAADLFASAEVGAWIDPQDITTLFQDRSGTPVVSHNDPVGLAFDKSRGLVRGTERCVDVGFNTGASWAVTGGASVSGGLLTGVGVGTCESALAIVGHVLGMMYEVSYEITRSAGAGGVWFNTTSSQGPNIYAGTVRTAVGTYKEYFATGHASGAPKLRMSFESGADLDVTSLSVKEFPGNHLLQTTAGARPLYKVEGNLRGLFFDGVDDGMQAGLLAANIITAGSWVCAGLKRGTTAGSGRYWSAIQGANELSMLGNTSGGGISRTQLRINSGTNYVLSGATGGFPSGSKHVLSGKAHSLLVDHRNNAAETTAVTTYTTETSVATRIGMGATLSQEQTFYGGVVRFADPSTKRDPFEAALRALIRG